MTDSTLPGLVIESLAHVATQTVQASPELAALWLAHNGHNRTLSPRTVDQYAADMAAGNWNFTGQPIIFDAAGHLIDGQHRLTAQVKVGVTLDWLVITGVQTATRDFIDIGRPRSVGNQLQIKGVGGNGVAAVARLDLIYRGQPNPSKPTVRAHAEAGESCPEHGQQAPTLDVANVSISVHLRIEPHRMVGPGEHPKIGPLDPPFTVARVIWSVVALPSGTRPVSVSLHDPHGTDGRGCLMYGAADAPSWVPRLPAEGWEKTAGALLRSVQGDRPGRLEVAARAIHAADPDSEVGWVGLPDESRDYYRRLAAAALAEA